MRGTTVVSAHEERGHLVFVLGVRSAFAVEQLRTRLQRSMTRIVRDAAGEFLGIVEQKDATPEQQAIREVNMSTYVFHAPDLLVALKRLGNNNAQREYYITDCPAILRGLGREVRARAVLEPVESLSINTPDELKVVERVILDAPQGTAGS